MNNLYCKCNTCNSLFESTLLETPCLFCGDSLNYKESNNISEYFKTKIPKLNDPKDFMFPENYFSKTYNKLPFVRNTSKNYLTRNQNIKNHVLSIIPIFKNFNNIDVLTNLCITWDNEFKNKSYGIFQDIKDNLSYRLNEISFENLLLENKDRRIKIYNKIVPDDCYERFLRNMDEFNKSSDISDLFSIYNSINWDLLDDQREKKTIYEYSAMNYLLHIFELIHVPNIDIIDYNNRLLKFDSCIVNMNFNLVSDMPFLSVQDFLDKYVNGIFSSYLEEYEFNDYEDIFDYFSTYQEGAIAPNAVGLNQAAQRSSAVFKKLNDLGYNPKMQIYSVGETTSLCPTFERDGTLYFIECNKNIMQGINEFESIEDMKSILNEVYNETNMDNMFITIEDLTNDVLSFILNNSNNSKEFLTRLIDLNSKKKEDFIYSNTVQDEMDFNDSIISEFNIVEMTPQNLFKYGKTHYKLRNCQKLPGNQKGYMFIDNNNNIVSFIIVENKIYNEPIGNRMIPTVISIEAASDFKDKGIELAMIDYYKKKNNIDNIRIECRNFFLRDRIENSNEYKEIKNNSLPFTLFESINEISISILNEEINASKRKQIEEKVYKVFSLLDKTGSNTQKYKKLFNSMSDSQFDKYIKNLLSDKNKNFYLEVLPNKNCPRIKDCKDALDYLKVPTEEYIYYRHDGHEKDPIRSRYKVPVLYMNVRRLQQMLSKKNTYSLDINKRNMKTG